MKGLKIFSENYINKDNNYLYYYNNGSGYISYSGNADYLYDQKPTTQWLSLYASDTVSEIIEIEFNNWQGSPVSRKINRLILLNHNIKDCHTYYWSGLAWNAISGGSLYDNIQNNNILEFAEIETSKIRLEVLLPQTVNDYKKIGEMKACLSILEDAQWRSDFSHKDSSKAGSYNLSDGPLIAWKEWTKAAGTLNLRNVTLTDLKILLPYIKVADFLTFIFHSDFDLAETFEASILSTPNYQLDRKKQLYSLNMELAER